MQASFWAGKCPVFAGRDLLGGVLDSLQACSGVLLTDNHVALCQAPFLDSFPADRWERYVVPAGENSKNPALLADLLAFCASKGLDKTSWVVGVGGGVVCDLASLTGALFLRGVHLGLFPTSLLAMADAAIGGKCAVNLPEFKNAMGVIHTPDFVFLNEGFLSTLPDREIRCGLAEIAKTALALDAGFWNDLTAREAALAAGDLAVLGEMAVRSARLKAQIVTEDEQDCSTRSRLNLGHSFAHALESLSGHALSHGEAVALGLVMALDLSEEYAGLPEGTAAEAVRFLRAVKVPLVWPPALPSPTAREFADLLQNDKKRNANHLRPVLCDRIGHAKPAEPLPAWNSAKWLAEWLEKHGRDHGFRQ